MKIYNNREAFYQWDMNQKITDTSFGVGDLIHFTTPSMSNALVVECYDLIGVVVVDVPNILLQGVEPITAYRYINDHTRNEYTFPIVQRAKPDDYFYEETETYTVKTAIEKALEATKSAQRAEVAAEKAEQSILSNGYAVFDIGEDGHLYLLRTPNIVDTLDFELINGRLEVLINE